MASLSDITTVLRQYQAHYRWLDVQMWFVDELRDQKPVFQLVSQHQYKTTVDGQTLDVRLYPNEGIARISLGAPSNVVPMALAGAALGAGLATAQKTDPGPGLLLGLLIGGLMGVASDSATAAPDENRIMTLVFDAGSRQWRVYQGPLVRWAKAALIPQQAS